MEKVLRESDDGIVIYVSPTKALVNQILASIYARYKKTMPPGKVGMVIQEFSVVFSSHSRQG